MTHRITLESGDVFDISADEDTLLRGALRAGIGFPHDCSVGGCGNCRFDLVAGEMETLWAEAPGLSERDRKRGRRLACQSRPRGDCTIRVRLADEYRPEIATRARPVRLVGRRDVTADIAEFTFTAEGPADFLAGQYGVFHLPGVAGVRAYSMSNLPNPDGEWRFVVRRVPGGAGSATMFDRIAAGDTVLLDAPYGRAHFREEGRDVVCVAGGSGIGPIVSIARAAAQAPSKPRLVVFEGARTRADLCFPKLYGGDLAGIDAYVPVLSAEPETSDWTGARGFVHAAVEAAVAERREASDFYFAGPPPMAEALQDLLVVRWTIPIPRLHYDRFF